MKRFVVYEIWTRSKIVEARSEGEALEKHVPIADGLPSEFSLSNWHAHEIVAQPQQMELPFDEAN